MGVVHLLGVHQGKSIGALEAHYISDDPTPGDESASSGGLFKVFDFIVTRREVTLF